LIAPISLYLIYARRAGLKRIDSAPSLSGFAILLGCLVMWWLGKAASISELRQFAIVGMIQAVVVCLLGWRFYRRILFPMLYLFLMVPTATALLGPLQTLTTSMSAHLLRLSGIPVLGENHLIEVPHGLYLVAPGCAGLNFLLSTLALSLVYVLVVYRRGAKRVAGVVVALLLSITTNAVRVFGIIWLAEATNRRIDIVDDHLLYGWGVYCVVMLAAMYIGLRFRESLSQQPAAVVVAGTRSRPAKIWAAALAVAIVAGGAQISFAAIDPATIGNPSVRVEPPPNMSGWRQMGADAALPPSRHVLADASIGLTYIKDEEKVDVTIGYFWRQRDGHKITDIAADIAEDRDWAVEGATRQIASAGAEAITIEEISLTRHDQHRLVWTYDWIGGHRTADALTARLMGMRSAFGADGRSAMVVLSAADDDGRGRAILADFLANAPMLDRALADASLRGN
jgi:EpsI family protein